MDSQAQSVPLWSWIEKELQNLLRETKKKQSQFRQVIEECIQNIHRIEQLEESQVLQNVLRVLVTALESKESKLVVCALSCVEFLLSHNCFDDTYGEQLLDFCDKQLLAQIEGKHKLKSLQVLILFCSYCVKQKYPDCDYLFRGLSILIQCLDSDVLQQEWKAAAEAGFRQIIAEAFDVVVSEETDSLELTPSMTSAYLLFQDLCHTVTKSNVSNRFSGHDLRRSLVYQILIDCIRSQAFVKNQVFRQLLLEVFPPVLNVENWTDLRNEDTLYVMMLFFQFLHLYIKSLPKECSEVFENLVGYVISNGISDEKINLFLGALFDLFQPSSFLLLYISNLANDGDGLSKQTSWTILRDLFAFLAKLVQNIPRNVFSANDPRVTAQMQVTEILGIVLDTKYQRAFLILKIVQRFVENLEMFYRSYTSGVAEVIIQATWPSILKILLCYANHHLSSFLHTCYIETWILISKSLRNMRLQLELHQLLKSICGILRENLFPLKDHWSMYVAQVRRLVSSLMPLLTDLINYFVSFDMLDEDNNGLNDSFALLFLLDYLSSQDNNFQESRQLVSDLNHFFKELLEISAPQQIQSLCSRCFLKVYPICSAYFESLPKEKPRMDRTFLARLLWIHENWSPTDTSLQEFLLLLTSEFVGRLMTNSTVSEQVQMTGANITAQVIHRTMLNLDTDFHYPIVLKLFHPMIVVQNIVVFDRVLQAMTEILQSYPDIVYSQDSWDTLLDMLYKVPMKEDYQLVVFRLVTVLSRDFISYLPCNKECLQRWTKFLCRYFESLKDLNLLLTCLGYIWNTIDTVSRKWSEATSVETQQLSIQDAQMHYEEIASILTEISVLTRDRRPEIRNSALKMIVDALKVAASMQFPGFWKRVCETFLIPTCEFLFEEARDEDEESSLVETDVRIHHSRNTVEKQWDESRIIFLEGLVKLCYQFWSSFIQYEDETIELWSRVVQFVLQCVNHRRTELCRAGVNMMISIFDCFCDQEAFTRDIKNGTERNVETLFWEQLWKILQGHFKADNEEANVPAFLTFIGGLKNLLKNSRHSFLPQQAKTLFDIVISIARSPVGWKSQELFSAALEFLGEAIFDKESGCWDILFEKLFELCTHSLDIRWDSLEYSTRMQLCFQTIEVTFQNDSAPLQPRLTFLSLFVQLLMPFIEQYSFEDSYKRALALHSLKALVVVLKSCVRREICSKDLDIKLFDRIVELIENFIAMEKKESESVDMYTTQSLSEYENLWRKESYDIILVDLLANRFLIHEEFLTERSWKKVIMVLRNGFYTCCTHEYNEKHRLRFRHACRVALLKWIRNQSYYAWHEVSHKSKKWSVIEETKLHILRSTLAITELLLEEKWNGGGYPLSSALCLETRDVFENLLKYETLSIFAQDVFSEVHLPREVKETNSESSSASTSLVRRTMIALREKLSICATLDLSDISELAVSLLKDMDKRVFVRDDKSVVK